MNPPLITLLNLGPVKIYTYGFFATLGFIFAFLIFYSLAKKEKLPTESLFEQAFLILVGGIIGGRLSYYWLYPDQFTSFNEIFYLWQGGLTSYGGFIGGLITAYFIFRKKFSVWFDLIAVSFWGGLFFWRIGCFLVNDHPGKLNNSFLAIGGRLPYSLLESIFGLVGLAVFYWLYQKNKLSRGYYFWLTVIAYSAGRFLLDFTREDPVYWLGLSAGQITSVVLLFIGLLGFGAIIAKSGSQYNKNFKVGVIASPVRNKVSNGARSKATKQSKKTK